MTYDTFKEQILAGMKDRIPLASLSIQSVVKNNNVQLDGLTIMEGGTNLSPTIYLNYFYETYQNGVEFSSILDTILHTYQSNKPRGKIDTSFFTDYANVRPHIAYKLIHYERNRHLLADLPHFRYLDLAIVFYCLVSSSPSGSATILICKDHLRFWNISPTQLFDAAKENTPRLLSYDLRNMNDLMEELLAPAHSTLSDPDIKKEDAAICPMYVLTNQNKLNGASCILYEHLLEHFADRLCCDLYILPSSIHEVILIPATSDTSYQELSQMVQEVNDTQVSPEEILSDHVYYFSRSSGSIRM